MVKELRWESEHLCSSGNSCKLKQREICPRTGAFPKSSPVATGDRYWLAEGRELELVDDFVSAQYVIKNRQSAGTLNSKPQPVRWLRHSPECDAIGPVFTGFFYRLTGEQASQIVTSFKLARFFSACLPCSSLSRLLSTVAPRRFYGDAVTRGLAQALSCGACGRGRSAPPGSRALTDSAAPRHHTHLLMQKPSSAPLQSVLWGTNIQRGSATVVAAKQATSNCGSGPGFKREKMPTLTYPKSA